MSSSEDEYYRKNPYGTPLTLENRKSGEKRRQSFEEENFEDSMGSNNEKRNDSLNRPEDENVVICDDGKKMKLAKKQKVSNENEGGEGKKRGRKPKAKKEDHYSMYEADQIRLFISLVEENPPIYDPQHPNFCRREVKNKLFDSIEEQCSHFMPRGRKYGAVAEARWNEVVADYKAHLRRNQKAPSGSGVEDIRSGFEFEHEMNFFNTALEKRCVKNAFVISGSKEDRLEHNIKSFENFASERKNKKKEKKDDILEKLVDQFVQSTKAIQQVASGNVESAECKSSRICEVFQEHTGHWSKVDKFRAEAQIINFIESLTPGSTAANQQRQRHPFSSQNFAIPETPSRYGFQHENDGFGHDHRTPVSTSTRFQMNQYEDPADISLDGESQLYEGGSYHFEFEEE